MTEPLDATARLKIQPGMVLALRLSIRNRMMAAALIRPSLDDWVADDGQILSANSRLEPAYVYLLQGAEARLTLTAVIPTRLEAGRLLRSALRFPGVQEQVLPLEVEILPPTEPEVSGRLLEHYLTVTLPFEGDLQEPDAGGPAAAARATYSLVAGLAGLDMIPARWLVAELLAVLAQVGAAHAETPEGERLLMRLGRTRFFKNGVLAFASAQAPQWIAGGLSTSSGLHTALGGQLGQGRLLYIWERWLLSLIHTDLEAPGAASGGIDLPPPEIDEAVAALGVSADRWFGNVVLGLARLSPRLAAVFEKIAAEAPPPPEDEPPPGDEPDDILGEEGSMQR